ncbi:MAG TPA: ABC transporter ATP-binding protein [Baekduia sp.]|uniref:ABC transporter ATP-binding protein n=1 Tax=Baekduia sp. TaxID=2600305 RepID=UPI002D767CF6|nr:ABC transporter ATP-binding protein [Baekduia sp.]HET6509072.1 ABC transporter ATP-binding protein [Baekduia sp.]
MSVLEVQGLAAGYGDTDVVSGLDLVVDPGSVTALLGANGAGKTTLLRAISGLLPARAGRVAVGGHDVTTAKPHARARRGLCLIPEGRSVYPTLTVAENLLMAKPAWLSEDRRDLALDAFPILKERLKQRAGTMSGGQQQMLALARCFIANPTIVLLDEVSMGLAPRIVDEIFVALERLAATGTALLLVEQYVHRALTMADAVHLMSRGSITYSGPPSGVDEESLTRGYLGAELETE